MSGDGENHLAVNGTMTAGSQRKLITNDKIQPGDTIVRLHRSSGRSACEEPDITSRVGNALT